MKYFLPLPEGEGWGEGGRKVVKLYAHLVD